MAMKRQIVLASVKPVITAGRKPLELKIWVASHLDQANEASHVFIHTNEPQCTRYHGIELLMGHVHKIPLDAGETLYAVTEDQAILNVAWSEE